jgi:hypothetical protein
MYFIGLVGLIWITWTYCLVNPRAIFEPSVDVKIWYRHGLKSTSINPRLSTMTSININGWTLESNNTMWGQHCHANAPLGWKTPSSLCTTIISKTMLTWLIVGCIWSSWSLVVAACQDLGCTLHTHVQLTSENYLGITLSTKMSFDLNTALEIDAP